MLIQKYSSKHSSAFTIVELLIVIVIIAVLATVAIVAFKGVQKRAMAATLQDSLSMVARAMETAAVDSGGYTVFPANLKLAQGVGVAITLVENTSTLYCINATTQKYDDLTYRIQKGGVPTEGLCEGTVVATLGDYNANAGGGSSNSTTASVAVTAKGDKYNFKVATNDTWSQITLSWDAQQDVSVYQIDSRFSTTGTWLARQISTGTGSTASGGDVTGWTGKIPPSTTSLTWGSGAFPSSIGQVYEYRLRYKRVDNSYSDWTTVALDPMHDRDFPSMSSFKVTPNASWSQVTLSWDSIGTYANLPGTYIQIDSRFSTTGTWLARQISTGTGSTASGGDVTGWTGKIPPSTTSLTWGSGAFPSAAGQTYEYRIRIGSATTSAAGSWVAVQLSR